MILPLAATATSSDLVLSVVANLAARHEGGARPHWTAAEVARRAERLNAELLQLRDGFIGAL